MSTMQSIKTQLQSLLDRANAKTGKSDTNLTDGVNTLIDGYGSGGGEIPTCTVRFVLGEQAHLQNGYAYSKYEGGEISPIVVRGFDASYGEGDSFEFENVVCGTMMRFNWDWDGDIEDIAIDGTAQAISSDASGYVTVYFSAPTVAGEVCTITLNAPYELGDWDGI